MIYTVPAAPETYLVTVNRDLGAEIIAPVIAWRTNTKGGMTPIPAICAHVDDDGLVFIQLPDGRYVDLKFGLICRDWAGAVEIVRHRKAFRELHESGVVE